MKDPVVSFVIAGTAVVVWMFVGDFPGLHEVFLWATGDDTLVHARPAWKYLATAVAGLLVFCLIVDLFVRTARGK